MSRDAGRAVGTEDQAEQPGYQLLYFLQSFTSEKSAQSAQLLVAALPATNSHPTPLAFSLLGQPGQRPRR